MALQLVLGCSGAGKTHYCYQSMIQASLKLNTLDKLLFIVPEQFTLESQKDMVELHPTHGIMSIEVLSFQRLAYRIFDEIGTAGKTVLGDTGKNMLIRKIIEEEGKGLSLIYKNKNKSGFISKIKSMITELAQYNISLEDLEQSIQDIQDNALLSLKLKDMSLVYSRYKNEIKKAYLTAEETLDLLAGAVIQSSWIKHATVWIDGFYGFTPIQYKVLRSLITKAKNVFMTLNLERNYSKNEMKDEAHLFYESFLTYNKLKQIAWEEGVMLLEDINLNNGSPKRFAGNEVLAHLEKNIFRYPYKKYKQVPKGMMLYTADTIKSEVDFAANLIHYFIRKNGYRYKDIAVVTGDLNGYDKMIQRSFNAYDIPYFIDKKKTILSHPLVELISSSLEIINKNWSYESVFRYLRTNLTSLCQQEIDRLDNYVLAYGIKGKNQWLQPWTYPYRLPNTANEDHKRCLAEQVNAAREKLIQPLRVFNDRVHRSKAVKVSVLSSALYELLEQLQVQEKIENYQKSFHEKGEWLLEREYAQIWKITTDLLDQMVDILGEESLTPLEYLGILRAGLEQCELGLVPPGLDQVVVGDLERTRLKEVKVLLLLGINEGKIPKPLLKAGLLTDGERDLLETKGIHLAPNPNRQLFEEQFLIYMGITKPSEKLILSFARTNFDGKTLRPSILVSRLRKIYPELKLYRTDEVKGVEFLVNQPIPTFKRLLENLKNNFIEDTNDMWKEVYSWYIQNKVWHPVTKAAVKGLYHDNNEKMLSKKAVHVLYGDTLINSVSRLEAFANCPFAHFLEYGLEVHERPVYEISMPDIGILFHQSIDQFSKKLSQRRLQWDMLEDTVRNQLIEETVIEVAEKYSHQLFFSNRRNEYLVKRLIRITKRAVWALTYQIKKGEFKPTDYEVAFNAKECDTLCINFEDNKTMQLRGRIDRVDKYENEDTVYVKIIDYKSGSKNFDIAALYYGMQLQLFVYLNAVTELEKNNTTKHVIPAGVFYYYIDDPIIKQNKEVDDPIIEKEIIKNLKMKGLVLKDIDIIKKMDRDIIRHSDVIPVEITSKGFGKRSSIASKEQMKEIQRYVQIKSMNIGKAIMKGQVDLYPYKDAKGTGCDYCPYSSICQFDPSIQNNRYHRLKKISKEDVFKLIQKEVQLDEG